MIKNILIFIRTVIVFIIQPSKYPFQQLDFEKKKKKKINYKNRTMNCFVIKFKNRDIRDDSNRFLKDIYTNGPKFDLDLVSSDNKVISAHKCVVFMFSKYLRDYLSEFKSQGKTCGEH